MGGVNNLHTCTGALTMCIIILYIDCGYIYLSVCSIRAALCYELYYTATCFGTRVPCSGRHACLHSLQRAPLFVYKIRSVYTILLMLCTKQERT
jgi:hypothetical protein